MHFPDYLKYTKDHMWIKVIDDHALAGITFFAQLELGEIAYVQIKNAGKHITKDHVFGTVEAMKAVSDMFLPVSGILVELNPLLQNEPELINKDPYEIGWIVKIKPDNTGDINELLTAEQYEKLVNG